MLEINYIFRTIVEGLGIVSPRSEAKAIDPLTPKEMAFLQSKSPIAYVDKVNYFSSFFWNFFRKNYRFLRARFR